MLQVNRKVKLDVTKISILKVVTDGWLKHPDSAAQSRRIVNSRITKSLDSHVFFLRQCGRTTAIIVLKPAITGFSFFFWGHLETAEKNKL